MLFRLTKRFSNIAPVIREIDTYESYAEHIMNGKESLILQWYVDWSEPCNRLIPILEDLTTKSDGKWALARLNCDTLPDIASAMQIKNLPSVYFIHEGKSKYKFVGIPSEVEFNSFINDVKIFTGHSTEQEVLGLLIT